MKKSILTLIMLILCISTYAQLKPYVSPSISYSKENRYGIELGVGNIEQKASLMVFGTTVNHLTMAYVGIRAYTTIVTVWKKLHIDSYTGGYMSCNYRLALQVDAGASIRYPFSNNFSIQINEGVRSYDNVAGGANSIGVGANYQF